MVYGFPTSKDQQGRWVAALPKEPTCGISKYVGVCEKHWHPDVEKVGVQGGTLRPTEPPSLFTSSAVEKALSSKPRNPNERNVTAEA